MENKTMISVQAPGSLVAEHKELHERLYSATQLTGKTGTAAKNVAKLLHEHFTKEEKYAMPQLGWLQTIYNDKFKADEAGIIGLSAALKKELPVMLAEHKKIVAELEKLINAAKEENHPEVEEFAKALKLHALTEEEVLYPTSILIGEYLKLKSQQEE
jgi:hypothetical protein